MIPPVKFCKDCKWFPDIPRESWGKAVCQSPRAERSPVSYDPVTGEPEFVGGQGCAAMRALMPTDKTCGWNATWFEPK
jgi:hypothetical protein